MKKKNNTINKDKTKNKIKKDNNSKKKNIIENNKYKIISLIFIILILLTAAVLVKSIVENKKNNNDKIIVVFETNLGNFKVELNKTAAPKTVENFLNYINEGFYNNLIFHRVIKGFVIQGGGFDKDMNKKDTNPPIPIESNNGLKNKKYTIAMARTFDPNSATSQFFINTNNNYFLDYKDEQNPGYTVFGKVIDGFETIDKIENVSTSTRGPYKDWPREDVIIYKAYVENE